VIVKSKYTSSLNREVIIIAFVQYCVNRITFLYIVQRRHKNFYQVKLFPYNEQTIANTELV